MVDVNRLRAELTRIVGRYIDEHPDLVAARRAGGTQAPADGVAVEPSAQKAAQVALAKLTSEKNKVALEQLKRRGAESPGVASLSKLLNRFLKPGEASGAREDGGKINQQDQGKKTVAAKKATSDKKAAADKKPVPAEATPGPVAPTSEAPESPVTGGRFKDTAAGKVFMEVGGRARSDLGWCEGVKGNARINFLDVTTPVYIVGLKEDLLLWLDGHKENYVATRYESLTPRGGRRYTADEILQANTRAARKKEIYIGAGKLCEGMVSRQAAVCVPNSTVARYCVELVERSAKAAAADAADDSEDKAQKAAEAASMKKDLEELDRAGHALVKESGPLYQVVFSIRPVGTAYALFHPDTPARQQRAPIAAIQVRALLDRAFGLLD